MKTIQSKKTLLSASVITMGLLLIASSFTSNVFAVSESQNIHSTKVQYIVKTGNNLYYAQFKACIGNEFVQNPIFTIKSDIDIKIEKYKKGINPNSCKTFETLVNAKYPNSIEIKLIN